PLSIVVTSVGSKVTTEAHMLPAKSTAATRESNFLMIFNFLVKQKGYYISFTTNYFKTGYKGTVFFSNVQINCYKT
ncbi:MAG: hypothetical protein IJ915_06940, partial [Paludibacteraceae bacterium]|nr:hypothetical protein [Paludibacteraceae bacterium]